MGKEGLKGWKKIQCTTVQYKKKMKNIPYSGGFSETSHMNHLHSKLESFTNQFVLIMNKREFQLMSSSKINGLLEMLVLICLSSSVCKHFRIPISLSRTDFKLAEWSQRTFDHIILVYMFYHGLGLPEPEFCLLFK